MGGVEDQGLALDQVVSVIVPESLIIVPPPLVPTPPPSVPDPLRFPVALAKVPVPPTIVSVSVKTPGCDGLGWHAPRQVKLLGNSWMKIMPPARLMVRTSHSGWV